MLLPAALLAGLLLLSLPGSAAALLLLLLLLQLLLALLLLLRLPAPTNSFSSLTRAVSPALFEFHEGCVAFIRHSHPEPRTLEVLRNHQVTWVEILWGHTHTYTNV